MRCGVRVVQLCVGSPDGDLAAFGHRINRIDDEIHEHLIKLRWIGAHEAERMGEYRFYLYAGPGDMPQHCLHALNDFIEVE